jgi:hypothetical protein
MPEIPAELQPEGADTDGDGHPQIQQPKRVGEALKEAHPEMVADAEPPHPGSLPISEKQYMDMMDAANNAGFTLDMVTRIAQSFGFENGEKVSVACYESMLEKIRGGGKRTPPKDADGNPWVSFPKGKPAA